MQVATASVQQNHGKRPYIGVVLNINGIEYFAPLASPKPKYYSGSIIYFKIFSHGTKAKLLGVIKLNCMIPVPKQYLKSVLIDTNTPYGLLLASQHRYIKSKQDAIKKEAHTLHHLVVEKKETHLVKMCCNYVLLEEKMTEHMQVLNNAKKSKSSY